MSNIKPYISVIVPAKNEEKYIMNVFKGLKTQSFKDFEVIIIDGGSTDNTVKISKKYARVIVDKRKGIGRARNIGAKIAKGKVLVFIDADTMPSKDTLKAYKNIINDKVVAATGPILPLEKTNLRITLGFKFVSIFFVKLAIKIGKPSIVGSNFAISKKAFNKINGFDEKLITYEDWDLSNRVKKYGKIEFVDDAVVYTSTRRVEKWGISGFFMFHVGNMIRYNLFKKSKDHYEEIR